MARTTQHLHFLLLAAPLTFGFALAQTPAMPTPTQVPADSIPSYPAAVPQTPQPAIYVSFTDFVTPDCLKTWKTQELCSVMVSDTGLQQGQGNHGGFTRANTRNFMAAIGPDFRSRYRDPAPVSNADITPTLAHAMGLSLPSKGRLTGRQLREALRHGKKVRAQPHVLRSAPAADGFVTVLETQSTGGETYLDAAGMPGRVVGLKTQK